MKSVCKRQITSLVYLLRSSTLGFAKPSIFSSSTLRFLLHRSAEDTNERAITSPTIWRTPNFQRVMADPALGEEDEDLKLAIAMSLRDAGNSGSLDVAAPQIDSHMRQEVGTSAESPAVLDDSPVPINPEPGLSTKEQRLQGEGQGPLEVTRAPPGLLGLDRAAMERERLERKRKAEDCSIADRALPTKRTRVAAKSPVRNAIASQTAPQPSHSGLQFPSGVVKKTWALGFPREDDIKIEEVLQRSDLQLAVLSSFQWDIDWLFSKLDRKKTKAILVMQAKEDSTKDQYRQETALMENLRLCFPPMPGNVSCMHSKLMLLSHPTHLRIVVPTANLVPYDWGETGLMENSVFLIDLPRLANGKRMEESRLTPFGQELLYFCRAMGLQEEVSQSLRSFDFSTTEDYAFVHTIGGSHLGDDEPWRRTGYSGLGRAVSQLRLNQPSGPLRIDFVASSLGSLNVEFLTALYLAAQGDDGTSELAWRNPKAAKHLSIAQKSPDADREATQRSAREDFKIYFPSDETVASSRVGPNGAGTICFQEKWFTSPKFPRAALLDCRSRRQGMLMHNKVRHAHLLGFPAPLSPSKVWCFHL